MVAELRMSEPTNAEVAQMAQRVVMARQMATQAKEAAKTAEEAFILISKDAGVDTVELFDGTLVTRVDADRRKIDVGELAELIPAATFERVTERKVNHKKFDAAVELGAVKASVIRKAVTATPYSAIRITTP